VPLATQLQRITELTCPEQATVEHRVTVLTLQSIAARIQFLISQAAELDRELTKLVREHPAGPALLNEPGVGPVVAAQLLVTWSHRGRVRSEAAFASLAGVAPLEASSGQRTRHRLNRGGDRDLNRALHTIAITRLRCHPESRAYEINAPPKARPTATYADPSNALSHDASTAESKPPPHHDQPSRSRPRPRLDKHRSVQRPAAPILPQR
jgi:hypothetical protein